MVWAKDSATVGGTVLSLTTFTYDVFGNLIQTADGSLTTRYGIDTTTDEVWAELDGSNTLQTRLIRPDSVDGLAAKETGSGTVSWYLTDRLGSVIALTALTGTVLDKRGYDGYGNIVSETSPSNGDAWGYTGRLFEATVGLQYNRARWYNPTTGTWTTQDPLDFAAGDTNLTRYVGNDATNATDPSGLLLFAGIRSGPALQAWLQGTSNALTSTLGPPPVPSVAVSLTQTSATEVQLTAQNPTALQQAYNREAQLATRPGPNQGVLTRGANVLAALKSQTFNVDVWWETDAAGNDVLLHVDPRQIPPPTGRNPYVESRLDGRRRRFPGLGQGKRNRNQEHRRGRVAHCRWCAGSQSRPCIAGHPICRGRIVYHRTW